MKNFFARVWADIQSVFSETEAALLASTEALIHSISSNGGVLLMNAATAAVAAAEAAGGSGGDKLKAAQASVIASLKSQGIAVVMNAVNGAIEAAVAEINQAKAATAGTASAGAP